MVSPQLLNVPNPFPFELGQLRLLESPDTRVDDIKKQLLNGTYGKPYIVDDGKLRCLQRGIGYVQSAMRIADPDALHLPYTHDMMGFLLFIPDPRRIVLLGLGGGSLAKFCYRALPNAAITAVEIDPLVISLRRHFAIPEDDGRFRVIQADAGEFVAHDTQATDVLLVDAFDAHGVSHSLMDEKFLVQAHASLKPSGMAILNLAGATSRYVELIEKVRKVFNQQTVLVSVRERRTFVLFAFKAPLLGADWPQLMEKAKELKAIYGLDFPKLTDKMRRASQGNVFKQLATTMSNLLAKK